MKTIALTFVTLLMGISSAFSQRRFTEGTITYDIVINSNSEKPKNADYLDGTTVANYIKGNRSRTEMVTSLGTLVTIQDSARGSYTILKEFGDQKYMITLTPTDWLDANRKYDGISFSYSDTSHKTVQGYRCNKAIGTLKDGTTYAVWYTPDLLPENRSFQYETRSLPGLPMEYEVETKDRRITYTVSRISFSPVAAAKFELPKTGYRVMTYAESKGRN